jgi:hypothetical protein
MWCSMPRIISDGKAIEQLMVEELKKLGKPFDRIMVFVDGACMHIFVCAM